MTFAHTMPYIISNIYSKSIIYVSEIKNEIFHINIKSTKMQVIMWGADMEKVGFYPQANFQGGKMSAKSCIS